MKPLEYNTLEHLASSNTTKELSQQTLSDIRQVQTPTQEGYMPQAVVLPIMEKIMDRQENLAAVKNEELPPEMTKYFLAINGEQKGPYSQTQVLTFLTQGVVTPSDLCWTQGLEAWTAIGTMPDFNKK